MNKKKKCESPPYSWASTEKSLMHLKFKSHHLPNTQSLRSYVYKHFAQVALLDSNACMCCTRTWKRFMRVLSGSFSSNFHVQLSVAQLSVNRHQLRSQDGCVRVSQLWKIVEKLLSHRLLLVVSIFQVTDTLFSLFYFISNLKFQIIFSASCLFTTFERLGLIVVL